MGRCDPAVRPRCWRACAGVFGSLGHACVVHLRCVKGRLQPTMLIYEALQVQSGTAAACVHASATNICKCLTRIAFLLRGCDPASPAAAATQAVPASTPSHDFAGSLAHDAWCSSHQRRRCTAAGNTACPNCAASADRTASTDYGGCCVRTKKSSGRGTAATVAATC